MENQKVFCRKCKKDLSDIDNLNECECGSKGFIYGKTVVATDKGFKCNCGCEKVEMVAHFNMNPKYISTYKCHDCGATISTETYYESQYY